ncbi:MAG: response regulator [Bacteroidales bacterium]|nr:response regulator [Candidatus Latescibacterota bacterium]
MQDRHSNGKMPSLRILLMDDEEMIRDVAGRMFRALGHEYEATEEGQEAVVRYRDEFVAGRTFDVVILDWNIRSGMSGFEAATMIREINADATILISSGNTGLITDDERFSRYFSGVLQKPYTVDDIRNVLEYFGPARSSVQVIGEKDNPSEI